MAAPGALLRARYRVITYNHRGYPPSSVPKQAEAYTHEELIEDLRQLLRALGIRQAHVGGLSMGANGWEEFLRSASEHDAQACAHIARGVIMRRKTIFELEERLRTLRVPTLIMVGDQDEPCIEPALFMRRHRPHAGLVMLPMSGHTINIEEPALFSTHVADFLTAVDNGRWGTWTA